MEGHPDQLWAVYVIALSRLSQVESSVHSWGQLSRKLQLISTSNSITITPFKCEVTQLQVNGINFYYQIFHFKLRLISVSWGTRRDSCILEGMLWVLWELPGCRPWSVALVPETSFMWWGSLEGGPSLTFFCAEKVYLLVGCKCIWWELSKSNLWYLSVEWGMKWLLSREWNDW